MEVRQICAREIRVGVAEVVVANAVVDRKTLGDLPGVFREYAGSGLRIAVVVGFRQTRDGTVGEAILGVGLVVDEVDEAIELERRLGEGGGEEGDVIAMPALVAKLDGVRAANVREDIAPVIAVLDENAQCKAVPEVNSKPCYLDDWNGEEAARWRKTLDTVIAHERFIQCVRRKGMWFVSLKR